MKKILIILSLLTITISTYCQNRFHGYQVESGRNDSIFPYHHRDTVFSTDVVIEIDEDKLTIHNNPMQEFFFYKIVEQTPDSLSVFISSSIFVDNNSNNGLITYSHNKFNNVRTIFISYNDKYLKYYLK